MPLTWDYPVAGAFHKSPSRNASEINPLGTPHSDKADSVCSPGRHARRGTGQGVSVKRGAGAGCATPPTSTNEPRLRL